MKKFLNDFRAFINRGNVMDMAIGIIIGGAFTGIVTSLVSDILNPIIGLFGGMNFDEYSVKILGKTTLFYGKFLTSIFNFLIMAFVVFLLVEFMTKAEKKLAIKKEEEKPAAPTTKTCDFCKTEINIDATRCPNCTSVLEEN